jgi:hypothetical protein
MVLHLHCAGHDLTRGEAHYTKVVIIHDKAGTSGEAQLAAQHAGGAQSMSGPEAASASEAMSAPEVISGPDAPGAGSATEVMSGPELVTPNLEAQDQWSTDYTLV